MKSRQRGWAGAARLAGLLTLAAGLLAVGSPSGTARVVSAGVAGGTALTSLTLTSIGPDGKPATAPSTQAALAANGRYVAFQSPSGAGQTSAIYVRDIVNAATTLVSNPAHGDATAPDISANGQLVSFEQAGDVYVADRRAASGGFTVRQVTGTANDLGYEHVVPCPAGLGAGRVTPCQPRLSADGSTLVYPAELTAVSPELSVSAPSGEGGTSALNGDMLDFSANDSGGDYGYPGGSIPVTYTNTGGTPISFSAQGVTVTEPPGALQIPPFTVSTGGCAGDTLAPGGSCQETVGFDANACYSDYPNQLTLVSGDLVTHASTQAGQSALELTGFCTAFEDYSDGPEQDAGVGHARAGAAGCPAPPSGLALVAPASSSDNQGAPLADVGAAEIGRPYVTWTTVQAPQDAPPVNVYFQSANGSDCQIRLVNPAGLKLADPLPASAPKPCYQGEQIIYYPTGGSSTSSPPSECTAYLLVSPGAVTPDSAFLGATSPSIYSPGVYISAYLTEQGVRHVIVSRRDPSGAGNFAASPSTVVSVTGQGAELPGATEPSVSADGRYVGFAAPVPFGTAGQQVAAGASQVWLRDTGPPGGKPGSTTLVSCLPRPKPGPCQAAANADSPSVSGDGQRVAFATTAAVAANNGYPVTSTDAAQGAGQVSPDQVYVRTTAARLTTPVSWPPCSKKICGGNGPSYAPAITEDGQTVGFVSRASDLTGTRVVAGTANLYLHPATGPGASEIASAAGASLPAGTEVGMPSLDAIGRLATFPASGALVPAAPAGVASVYTFDRLPSLAASPGSAAFGTVLIDSGTRSVPVTVTNAGPGPGTVTGVAASGSFAVGGDGCAGVLLSAGSACTVTVTFTPSAVGPATGGLTVTTQDDGEPPVTGSFPATATVPAPRVTVSPGLASAGETTQVSGSFFPPGRKVTLTWSAGLGSAVAVTSGAGSFGAYMVIFPDDVIGPRQLVASAGAGVLASAPFLVQRAAAEPPFTASPPP